MKAPLSAALLAALVAGPVHAACTYPKAPERLPDGATATKEEMLAGQKAVKEYDAQINAFLECLKKEHDERLANGTELTDEQRRELERIHAERHNAAVDELQTVAARFNEQVRVWKAKNEKS